MTTTEWTDVPEQRTDDSDPLAKLSLELVPKEEPPSPTAIAWIEQAMADSKSRGRVPLADQATWEVVRAALRKAAVPLNVTVQCQAEKDKKDKLVALTFTVMGRRGRKTDA
jgi:hypothetical protein